MKENKKRGNEKEMSKAEVNVWKKKIDFPNLEKGNCYFCRSL